MTIRPYVDATILKSAINCALLLRTACLIYSFHWSLGLTQTPRIHMDLFISFACMPPILTVDTRLLTK